MFNGSSYCYWTVGGQGDGTYVRKLNGVSHKPFQLKYILNIYVITGSIGSILKALNKFVPRLLSVFICLFVYKVFYWVFS